MKEVIGRLRIGIGSLWRSTVDNIVKPASCRPGLTTEVWLAYFIIFPIQTNCMSEPRSNFKPFVPADVNMPELTIKSILTGAAFGIIFGASTVYLA